MTPADTRELWDLITTHLDDRQRFQIGIPLIQSGRPRDWIERLLHTVNHPSDDGHDCGDSCLRDHCPTNCSPNCHLTPTGAHDAKA